MKSAMKGVASSSRRNQANARDLSGHDKPIGRAPISGAAADVHHHTSKFQGQNCPPWVCPEICTS